MFKCAHTFYPEQHHESPCALQLACMRGKGVKEATSREMAGRVTLSGHCVPAHLHAYVSHALLRMLMRACTRVQACLD
jgi:hypothetical protein